MTNASNSADLRAALVAQLVDSGALRTTAVRDAFLAVPREEFVPQIAAVRGLTAIYVDAHLITRERDGQPTSSSSQSSIMALMLDALAVEAGQRVLEVGLGTGYNAALLAHLTGPTGQVTAIDIDADAAAALRVGGFGVTTIAGDGRLGHSERGPYDRIIVTASTTIVPRAWWEQLTPDGLLVVPVRVGPMQLVAVLERTPSGFRSRQLIRGGFMALRGVSFDMADVDELPTLAVRTAIPGRPSTNVTAHGPALARSSPQLLAGLAGHLLRPPLSESVDAVHAWPVIWHTIMTTDPHRQISLYGLEGGVRFGILDVHSGAFAAIVVGRAGDDWIASTMESYGPAQDCVDQLRECINGWLKAGSPPFERLTLDIAYGATPKTEGRTDGRGHQRPYADARLGARWPLTKRDERRQAHNRALPRTNANSLSVVRVATTPSRCTEAYGFHLYMISSRLMTMSRSC